jgi:hypothetical protein
MSAALKATTGKTTLLVAAGTYAENLLVDRDDVAIFGSSDPAAAAGIIVQAPATDAAIAVTGSGVTLQGIIVQQPSTAGIYVSGAMASATIAGCKIDGAKAVGGNFGFGVLANNSSIIVQHTTITGSASYGVAIVAAKGSVSDSTISGNAQGGIYLLQTTDQVRVERNQITNNTTMGIGVFSSRAIIVQNGVTGTTATTSGDVAGIGDGVIVSDLADAAGTSMGPSVVEVSGSNDVSGNARAGLLMNGQASGIIVQNNLNTNGRAGLFLQQGAGTAADVEVRSNTLTGNKAAGIGLTTAAHGIIVQNTIGGTMSAGVLEGVGTVQVGDGIGVYQGSGASITGNTVMSSARIGILVDAADGAKTTITGNNVPGNTVGIIVQNPGAAPATVSANTGGAVMTLGPSDMPYPTASGALGSKVGVAAAPAAH